MNQRVGHRNGRAYTASPPPSPHQRALERGLQMHQAGRLPDAEAVYLMGWIGFLAVVPWIQALGWSFRPTTVIDVRYLPKQERIATEEMIARLAGKASPTITPPETSPGDTPS